MTTNHSEKSKKLKELVLYLVFGVATTLVNFGVLKLFNVLLGEELYLISNIIAWFVSVVFAYLTNKLFVFESKSWKPEIVWREMLSFFAARVVSFLIEEGGLFLLVEYLGFKELVVTLLGISVGGIMIAKVILAVVVVILNYFFSKLIIFRKKQPKEQN